MNLALEALRQHPALWSSPGEREALPTGFEDLDRLLPGGGWPVGALIEVLGAREGVGELRLLVPALARLTRQRRFAVWISPPHIPYGPALAACGVDLPRVLVVRPPTPEDGLWAAEQALGSGTSGAVLAWVGEAPDRSLRRLQLAAERGKSLGFLFRPVRAADRPSPAALRLAVEPAEGGLAVHVLKGREAGRGVVLGRGVPAS
ncbi:MAG: translesion DNA synthesis-associated protein ImuA [Deltaproteobacteria bacterium]|nr:translesion DNA synthesis-associated protein ImuA [Deltaproteobacteria bacterium]